MDIVDKISVPVYTYNNNNNNYYYYLFMSKWDCLGMPRFAPINDSGPPPDSHTLTPVRYTSILVSPTLT